MEKVILKVSSVSMESHLAMDDCHYLLQSCVILNDSHELKGKKIMISTDTPKKKGIYGSFGKSKKKYYIENSDKKFDSIDDFCNEYGFILRENKSEQKDK